MHLGSMEAEAAIVWLEQHLGRTPAAASSASRVWPLSPSSSSRGDPPAAPRTLRLPRASQAQLERVRRYLTGPRCLAADVLEPLIDAGRVYADPRGNAVFLMVAGKPHRPIGAELRGTGDARLAWTHAGTCKDAGYFWVVRRTLERSCSAKRRLTPSVATSCIRVNVIRRASASRRRVSAAIRLGYTP